MDTVIEQPDSNHAGNVQGANVAVLLFMELAGTPLALQRKLLQPCCSPWTKPAKREEVEMS